MGVRIGHDVRIYQHVTLGSARRGTASYPIVNDQAVLFSGAVIVGNIEVGKGAVIGANAVVLKSVPEGHSAVGNPARVVGKTSKASDQDFAA